MNHTRMQRPMFQHLTPLDTDTHKNLCLNEDVEHIHQAAQLQVVPADYVDFEYGCKEYPIVFIPTNQPEETGLSGKYMAVFVCGLVANDNLFVEGDVWKGGYIPAFVRAYPFAVIQPDGDPHPTVCIDGGWKGFSETTGQRLISDDGDLTPYANAAFEFAQTHDTNVIKTVILADELERHGLLKDYACTFESSDGRSVTIDGFKIVDVDALTALPDEVVGSMNRRGVLRLIERLILSMTNFDALRQLHFSRHTK